MKCENCPKEISYRWGEIIKQNRKLCKSCYRAEWCKRMWKKRKSEGKIHHWKIKAAWQDKKRSEIDKKKFSDAHKKPENILIALNNLSKADNRRERSPHWIIDRNKVKRYFGSEERRSPAYKFWRKEVCTRDKFRCKINNKDCDGRIEVHHILGFTEYEELRYQPNNGITLCHAHHPRKRAEEKRLSPYFMELVSALNV